MNFCDPASLGTFFSDADLRADLFIWCPPLADNRMSKPVEVEKVGADSPLEGTGKMLLFAAAGA